jgi:hypothetical protein
MCPDISSNTITFQTFPIFTVEGDPAGIIQNDFFITSGYRNPNRHLTAGSISEDGRHTLGRALDLRTRNFQIPGLIEFNPVTGGRIVHPLCILELAGDLEFGTSKYDSIFEASTLPVACDDDDGNHIHISD